MTKIEIVICSSIVLLLILVGYASYNESIQWNEFKIQRKCKEVSKAKGEIFNTFGTDAKGNISIGIASTSDKTGWLCDDGITYYR